MSSREMTRALQYKLMGTVLYLSLEALELRLLTLEFVGSTLGSSCNIFKGFDPLSQEINYFRL